ncbi:MAG: IS1182 family transposase [Williamsia sp.]|nr:IS1182 family transposase [Williamsia sp.]
MQGKKQYTEQLFTSFQLSQHVPEDNFYRRLKDVLDLKWLYAATQQYYGSEGQQSIDPVVFFRLILIGYLENLSSDRRIISTVSMRLDMLYFIGYNIDEPLPWHSTLSRTRGLWGEDLFKDLFKKVLKQCIDKGMVAGRMQAIDSVAVKANASMSKLAEKEVLLDAEAYTAELQQQAEETGKEDKGDDDKTDNTPTVTSAKHKSVTQHHNWKRKAYRGKPKGGRSSGAKFVSNHTHYSTTDPDSRISVKPGKPRQLNYHAQVSVDTAHHVITAIQSHHADKRDSQCLSSIVKATMKNLSENHLQTEEILADAGYSSGEALRYLEEKGITGYIPNFGQYKSERAGFTYHEEGDYYTCSRGVRLTFKRVRLSHDQYEMRQYRSSAKDCKACPLRSGCIGSSPEKKIEDSVDKPYYDRMHQRLQTAKAKQMKELRSSTVEPVLGTLVNFLGMRRVNTRGLVQSSKCMLMAAVAYNLKKLLKWTERSVETGVKEMQKELTKAVWLLCRLRAAVTAYRAGGRKERRGLFVCS